MSSTPRAGLMLGLVLLVVPPLYPAEPVRYEPTWSSLDQRPTPEWYLDAKFGVFIHWGVYSVPAWGKPGEYAEWYWQRIKSKDPKDAPWAEFHAKNYGADFDYKDFAPRFTAELFNASQWTDVFARAGIRYVVPTSKHHEGFALWPSAEASRTWGRPWNAVEIGPKRDLMGELAAATRARGMKFGFYYSLYEWFNPLWLQDRARYVDEHMIPQFKDVVTRYQPAIIFSDGEWDLPSSAWKSEQLLAWLYNESPSRADVVVNDRWGKETRHKHGGYWTTEYAAGLQDGSHPWEESRGMAYSYGLNRAERFDDYKSARELILVLIDLVSRGGNLLLDIGPAADGTIPPLMEQRLLEMGDWLKVNGEAIYGTRFAGRSAQWTAGTRPKQEYGEYMVKYHLLDQVGQAARNGVAVKQVFFTKKPDALYAISVGWPGKKLVLRGVSVPAGAQLTMLGLPGALAYAVQGGDVEVTLPDLGPDAAPCQHAYTIKLPGGTVTKEQAE
ncbi:Alpha-L-fucosidase [Lacunisphaera limnophila]|uniref:alpha-L-fucosidase n=1 Tax=Lacunisphaera limnophila TaxID=1838286 RepID=A0A1D8AYB1_9BACT|nr:alpha-L-fucosidase [Lacunisphaera limnophila]AOS45851.1 Alpha-L-fucosidase [Lacunisphaera limnophila]